MTKGNGKLRSEKMREKWGKLGGQRKTRMPPRLQEHKTLPQKSE